MTHSAFGTMLVLLPLLGAGCVGAPPADRTGARVSAQRVLAIDFGVDASAARAARLRGLPAAFADELRRPQSWGDGRAPVRTELRRVGSLTGELRAGAASELHRAPRDLGRFAPSLHEVEQDLADGLDQGLRLFGPGLHPLGEISDREHRTDHRDDRPELSLWARLRRRLGL